VYFYQCGGIVVVIENQVLQKKLKRLNPHQMLNLVDIEDLMKEPEPQYNNNKIHQFTTRDIFVGVIGLSIAFVLAFLFGLFFFLRFLS
jgi:hypothetical protein